MLTTTVAKTQCFICGKEKSTYFCRGCSQDFCFNHLTEHSQILSKQFDEIENDRDQFRQTLIDQKEYPNKHLLFQQINKWEEYSINKIKQTAKECKQILIKYTNNYMIEIENKLIKLTEQLRQIRQENEFNEIDLNELKSKLTKLREEFVKPPHISIQQRSTSFINKISVVVSSDTTNLATNKSEDATTDKQLTPTSSNTNLIDSLLRKIQDITRQQTQQEPVTTAPPSDTIDIPIATASPIEPKKCPVCNYEFASTTNNVETYDHIEKCLFPTGIYTEPKDYECPNYNRKFPGIDERAYLEHLSDCYNRDV